MHEQEIRVQTPEGEMTTFVTHPDEAGSFPVAVLYMDAVGYREQLKENARRSAADGYYCVAPDLFYHSGEQLTFHPSQARRSPTGQTPPTTTFPGFVASCTSHSPRAIASRLSWSTSSATSSSATKSEGWSSAFPAPNTASRWPICPCTSARAPSGTSSVRSISGDAAFRSGR